MGMISIAGAPILNCRNGTRRPSNIKTKDQEMMKSWMKNYEKKRSSYLKSSYKQAITVDRIQRLVTDTPKVFISSIFIFLQILNG